MVQERTVRELVEMFFDGLTHARMVKSDEFRLRIVLPKDMPAPR